MEAGMSNAIRLTTEQAVAAQKLALEDHG